uniref:Uncharacterized protein n=1 Tax=Gasterosteus aculeatus aculeatus TaxID=481459 RepID=A0AAQ4QCI9_GASAC
GGHWDENEACLRKECWVGASLGMAGTVQHILSHYPDSFITPLMYGRARRGTSRMASHPPHLRTASCAATRSSPACCRKRSFLRRNLSECKEEKNATGPNLVFFYFYGKMELKKRLWNAIASIHQGWVLEAGYYASK